MFRAVVDQLSAPVVLVGTRRRIIYRNPVAIRTIGGDAASCCDVICGSECLTRAALRGECGDEYRIERAGGRTWTVSASRLPDMEAVVLVLNGHSPATDDSALPPLRIHVLGHTRLEVDGFALDGSWLEHRPGQVLKYLVAARGRIVTVDELVDALWPSGGATATASVRQAIHNLRLRLEPERAPGSGAGYVRSHRRGYALNTEVVRLDVEDFERLAAAGLGAAEVGDVEHAETMLITAAARYRGEFLQDEPFADWALAERDRLRALAAQVLRTLARVESDAGDLRSATERLERLAEIEPLDLATQRDLLRLMIKRGRHNDAARRYELIRRRYRRAFGQDPDFGLAELASRR